jgi:hypothetical protein
VLTKGVDFKNCKKIIVILTLLLVTPAFSYAAGEDGDGTIEPGEIIWGVGPTVNMPTNTDDSLGNDT